VVVITEAGMASDETRSCAHRQDDGSWRVSWLPYPVERNAAISAMVLAEQAGQLDGSDLDAIRLMHIAGWAAELGLEADEAIDAVMVDQAVQQAHA
jgi:hypothetical protein